MSFRTASFGSLEYSFGSINRPSERSGSELKPITGFTLSNNGHARLAVNKNVPSPPIGTKISAHFVCFVDNVTLKGKKNSFFD